VGTFQKKLPIQSRETGGLGAVEGTYIKATTVLIPHDSPIRRVHCWRGSDKERSDSKDCKKAEVHLEERIGII
jgi:hypothetical protein